MPSACIQDVCNWTIKLTLNSATTWATCCFVLLKIFLTLAVIVVVVVVVIVVEEVIAVVELEKMSHCHYKTYWIGQCKNVHMYTSS